MPKELDISIYYSDSIIIDNDVEIITINEMRGPLKNIPPSVSKIIVENNNCRLRKEHIIPYGCELIIKNTIINQCVINCHIVDFLNKLTDEDCLEITELPCYGIDKVLPNVIGKLINLKILNVYGLGINEIPDWIGNLTKLKQLDCGNNYIKTIPECIGNLTKLHCLDLSLNQITELPETIENLTSLHTLYLNNNKIEFIGNIETIKKIKIDKNPLKELPESIRIRPYLILDYGQ